MNDVNHRGLRRVAVIDIGASSVRMQIAEIFEDGRVNRLNRFSQGVSLGRDSFSSGTISRETINDCINVLRSYRNVLVENRVDLARDVRVVATSGLVEASNRLAFQDRVAISTGFEIEAFDAAQIHRVTYLGMQPFFDRHSEVFDGNVAVCEVGGGTTEFLFLHGTDVVFSRTFRLGALRLHGSLASVDGTAGQMRELYRSRIETAVQQIQHIVHSRQARYVAMGGDIRLAASSIAQEPDTGGLVRLPVDAVEAFIDKVFDLDPARLANKFRLGLPEARSLGPALMIHLVLARRFDAQEMFVVPVNLRDSLIMEMAMGRESSERLDSQIIRSAELLAGKYEVDIDHALAVTSYACQLFDQLSALHELPARYRMILHLAGLLHECGQFVSSRSYHKHGMYLVLNSELFGVNQRDQQLVALVVRYHRRALPQPGHEVYSLLGRGEQLVVAKLASILRMARALNASRTHRIGLVRCAVRPGRLQIVADGMSELSAEQVELRQDGQMFAELFGLVPELIPGDARANDR